MSKSGDEAKKVSKTSDGNIYYISDKETQCTIKPEIGLCYKVFFDL